MVRPIINSEKRIVQQTLSTAMMGVSTNEVIAVAEQAPTSTDPREVDIGTVIKAVYVELWVMATSQQPATITTCVIKVSNGGSGPSAGEMTDLNSYNSKKNIFEMHQGLIGDANTNPTPFYRGWIKIPKGKQRFGQGDRLILAIKSITDDTQYCGVYIYKAYN